MLKQIILLCTLMVIGCRAGSYGYGSGSGSKMSSRSSSYSSSSYGGSSSPSYSKSNGGPIIVSVKSKHNVQYYDVPSTNNYEAPTDIEVSASAAPINLLFRSVSSYINVKQLHQGAEGSNQETESEDQAHYLKHTVKKPVYQELVEIITPQRKIVQEIKPVEEEIETLVARGQKPGPGPSPYSAPSSGYGPSPSMPSPAGKQKSGY